MASNEQTRPGIGDLAKDTASGKVGIIMGEEAGRVQIRPPSGGREWDALPENVVPPSTREKLDARLAVENARTKAGL